MAALPLWLWILFIFCFGACIGSFLNVVIYRLPRGMSLNTPRSQCPSCQTPIQFYDNIPVLSWLVLRAKCRYCSAAISPRYFVIEVLTALIFVGVFLMYFVYGFRSYFVTGSYVGVEAFAHGGWLVYLLHMTLVCCLIAASAIDLELWVIPISICWLLTAAGLLASAMGGYVIQSGDPAVASWAVIHGFDLLPNASGGIAALAAGAGLGMILSMILLTNGVIKASYFLEEDAPAQNSMPEADDPRYNHRLEVLKEILFLGPIVLCSVCWFYITRQNEAINSWWLDITQIPALQGFFGSLWGYFVGAGIVWATRILGTLGFGKEAMGLGDVHLMGAAGAILGPVMIVVAFFAAPFFGLVWALYQMFFQKTRQIPYGPFLSLAIFGVMIFHDSIQIYLSHVLFR